MLYLPQLQVYHMICFHANIFYYLRIPGEDEKIRHNFTEVCICLADFLIVACLWQKELHWERVQSFRSPLIFWTFKTFSVASPFVVM